MSKRALNLYNFIANVCFCADGYTQDLILQEMFYHSSVVLQTLAKECSRLVSLYIYQLLLIIITLLYITFYIDATVIILN